ncbi:MAG: amino acid ABC transporter permease [Firmicutes bacterium]|nr:amino acid ABC transporter permease [Bacillota bacterium]
MHVALHYLGVYGVGALKDIALTIVSTILSIILGVLAAAGRLYGPKALQIAIAWYVEIIRGLPAILQLFIIYFGFDQIGIHFSPLMAALIWLVAYGVGYAVEIFRAGLMDVAQGQREASAALGLSPSTTMRKIVFPQALVAMLPPLTSFVVLQLKNTTLLYLVGFADVMYEARLGVDATNQAGPLYVMAAVVYLIISLVIGRIGMRMERRAAAYR